jgi:molecular chaperone DnaK
MQASHKLAEQMYAKAGAEQAQAGATETASASAPGGEKENVVDAQFEEVKDNKK